MLAAYLQKFKSSKIKPQYWKNLSIINSGFYIVWLFLIDVYNSDNGNNARCLNKTWNTF